MQVYQFSYVKQVKIGLFDLYKLTRILNGMTKHPFNTRIQLTNCDFALAIFFKLYLK